VLAGSAQDAYSTNADGSIYTYSTNADGSANIVAYAGPPWVVTIPTNINGLTVTTIGEVALYDDNLTSVMIPDSVTNIGAEAFVEDYSLTAITVDTNNPAFSSLNGVLFDKSQTTLIEYPGGLGGSYTVSNSVTSIGEGAFEDCTNLTSVTIGTNVTSIGDYAFDNCTSLTGVTIPDSITSIGEGAFQATPLTSVTIPASVTNIGEAPFESCSSLTAITVKTNNPAFSSLNGVLFDKSQTTLIEYPGGLGGSYTISNSVTNIGDSAFKSDGSLTSVAIPDSVTSIGAHAFLFTSLTNATIGNGVTSIGEEAFAFTSLTSITIPNSVTSIGDYAFVYDYSLTRVTIGNGVTSIGEEAFDDGGETDDSLTGVYFMGNAPAVDLSFRGDNNATAYYLPGTTGWSRQFLLELGLPTALWFLPNPQILNHSANFGVQPGGFGFTISWATNASVVVEAATNLANPVWIPVSTNTLVNGTNHFSDPQWTNYSARYYRLQMP
jgi:hypothetical protein